MASLIPLCPQKEAFLINISFEERKEISSGNSKSTIPGCSSRRLINQNCLISNFCLSIPGEKWNFHFLDFLYHNKKSMDNNRNSHLPNFESTFIPILFLIYKSFSSGRVHLHGESIPSPIFNRSQGWRRGAHGAQFVPHTWAPGVTDSLTSLRYESSTLILHKELSSTIFQSCQSVSQSVSQASVTPVQISTFCNI